RFVKGRRAKQHARQRKQNRVIEDTGENSRAEIPPDALGTKPKQNRLKRAVEREVRSESVPETEGEEREQERRKRAPAREPGRQRRQEDVFPDPGLKRDVPAPPEIRQRKGGEWPIEV